MIQSILIQPIANRVLNSMTLVSYKKTNRCCKTPVSAKSSASQQQSLN